MRPVHWMLSAFPESSPPPELLVLTIPLLRVHANGSNLVKLRLKRGKVI